MTRMILFRTGWMKYYRGNSSDDQLIGGGEYPEEHGTGHELFNFFPFRENYFGNVQPPNDGAITLENIASGYEEKSFIEGVTIIWCAIDPENGGMKVCGWYKNATVYRDWQKLPESVCEARQNVDIGYYRSSSMEAYLLSPENCKFVIPRATEVICGFGTSQIRYLYEERCKKLKQELNKYIDSFSEGDTRLVKLLDESKMQEMGTGIGFGGRNPEVEKEAIKIATEYYVNRGFKVRAVELEHFGWDIEASKNGDILKIEVKGLSGPLCSVGLTTNEYNAFNNQDNYRLFIVTLVGTDPTSFLGKKGNGRFVFLKIGTKRKFESKKIEVTSAVIALGNELR